ncbi:hypothetical protein BDQ17DRAFT_1393941 [Cyathus striatus]|nr:hypothetical protein BDQ17DRAFT_1393941 [Cyathus striatus]
MSQIINFNKKHYFSASRYYCVETICAPCGAVIAWTKFVKSNVFPNEESRPDYICIDKACKSLRTAVANGSWVYWFKGSHFVGKWCNPAPQDGSAPNLVYIAQDRDAFNTQACEQLNSWLGGFESI